MLMGCLIAISSIRQNMVEICAEHLSYAGAYQNESMKQLTIVTCMFLPLTFLTVCSPLTYYGICFR